MSALIIAFCAESQRRRVCSAVLTPEPPMLLWHDAAGVDVAAQHRPLILLAIGPEGGAALARWVEAHGLEGVAGVGLVGVTAPWAERGAVAFGDVDEPTSVYAGAVPPLTEHLPLGPLEPLRAVAERARVGRPCSTCGGSGIAFDLLGRKGPCKRCSAALAYPLRCVIACAPDDGVCGVCDGRVVVAKGFRW